MCWCWGLLVACPPLPPPAEQTALSSDLRQTRRGGTAHRSPALQQLALGGELQNPERGLQGRGMDQSSRHILLNARKKIAMTPSWIESVIRANIYV